MDFQTVDELLARTRSQIGLKTKYLLGGGVFKANRHSCQDASGSCDCSAFACWALGVDKQGSYPYLVGPGQPVQPGNQWYGTDNIVNDAVHLAVGLFQKVDAPAPGALIVFPSQKAAGGKSTPGHVGIVTEVRADGSLRVVHCSSRNFKAKGDAIQETDDAVFKGRNGLIYAWCSKIVAVAPAAKKAAKAVPPAAAAAAAGSPAAAATTTASSFTLSSVVRFVVVAAGADGEAIRTVANAVAALNPFGRRVVAPGDADYPSAAQIASWTAGTASPGAVVLTPGGAPSKVLTISQAQKDLLVDAAFANAAAG